MPANLTPEYKAAEAAYRRARDPRDRLECLREMLRTIPKHKGTDYLQAELKRVAGPPLTSNPLPQEGEQVRETRGDHR